MTIFDFADYRTFLKKHIAGLPRNGRGEINRLAQAAGIHPSLLSQILAEQKNLSLEQAHLISEHMDLTQLETEYFLLLVQHHRAGTSTLKKYFKNKLDLIKNASSELSKRVRQDRELSENEKAIVYSHWLYLAVWLFTSIDEGKTVEEVVEKFSLSRERAIEILTFLTQIGLCVFDKAHYKMGSQSIHVGRGSPHLHKHHTNWRLRAIEASDHLAAEELMYSAPMSISKADFTEIRSRLTQVIKDVTDRAIESKAEDIVYFGIDFFWLK